MRTGWAGTSDAIFDGSGAFINNAYTSSSSIGIAQVAGQYAFGPVTFGLGYSNAQYKADANSAFGTNQKYNTGRAFVTYQASAPLLLGLGYIYTKGSGQTDAKYHQVSLGADYSLSKRTDVYLVGAYQHASGKNADGSDAQASVGCTASPASRRKSSRSACVTSSKKYVSGVHGVSDALPPI